MIPKIIHYCWFGEKEKNNEIKYYLKTWKQKCPDYQIIEWNEDNINFCQNNYCREAYMAKKWAFVSDYVRLKVLYEYGGFYMDTDIEVIKSLDNLCTHNAVVGYESGHNIQTGIIGACRHNKWISILLKSYDNKHFIQSNGCYDMTPNVASITNLTQQVYKLVLDGNYKIFGDNMLLLPFDYLCAKDLRTGQIKTSKNTYTIHHFSGSWVSEFEKYSQRMTQKITNIFPYEIAKHVGWLCSMMKFYGIKASIKGIVKKINKHL